jgi:cell division protein FtsI (penicillin-binding protein 3)
LYKLQIVQGEKLTEKARNQQMVTLQLFIPRQIGVVRNNKILAFDRLVYTLYAHPKLVEKSDEQVAQKLAPILNTNANELVKNFQNKISVILLKSALPELAGNHVNLWWYCRCTNC